MKKLNNKTYQDKVKLTNEQLDDWVAKNVVFEVDPTYQTMFKVAFSFNPSSNQNYAVLTEGLIANRTPTRFNKYLCRLADRFGIEPSINHTFTYEQVGKLMTAEPRIKMECVYESFND